MKSKIIRAVIGREPQTARTVTVLVETKPQPAKTVRVAVTTAADWWKQDKAQEVSALRQLFRNREKGGAK
jgi:hypothetical protein